MIGCKSMISWFPLYFFINQSIDWSIKLPWRCFRGLDWRALPSWWPELEAKECPSSAITVWASGPCDFDAGTDLWMMHLTPRGKRMWLCVTMCEWWYSRRNPVRSVGDCQGDDTQVARAFEEIGKQTGGKLDILAPTLASDNQSWQGPAKVWQPELVLGHASQEWV